MSGNGPLRSKQGCWTCRLRRKKCDERHPSCVTCDSLAITCYGYGSKPDWMDGGEREKAMATSIKQIVKHTSRRKGRFGLSLGRGKNVGAGAHEATGRKLSGDVKILSTSAGLDESRAIPRQWDGDIEYISFSSGGEHTFQLFCSGTSTKSSTQYTTIGRHTPHALPGPRLSTAISHVPPLHRLRRKRLVSLASSADKASVPCCTSPEFLSPRHGGVCPC
jgi:hypothetical protein